MASWSSWLDNEVGQLIAAGAAAIFGVTRIRTYLKSDSRDNAALDAERNIIDMLRKEVTRMAEQVTGTLKAIAELQAENRALREQNERLLEEVHDLKKEMRARRGT
jgi:peptidoglycan hydrolase CwlO-like protein